VSADRTEKQQGNQAGRRNDHRELEATIHKAKGTLSIA
jgi:hypothetical protein